MELLWTMCVEAMCSRKEMCILIRLSEIYFRDCLTKFDCDLITVEWPIVSSRGEILLQFRDWILCWSIPRISLSLIMSLTLKENRKRSKKHLVWRSRFTHFLWSLKKSILQFLAWQNENIRANRKKKKTNRDRKDFMSTRCKSVNKAKNYFNDCKENALKSAVNAIDKHGKLWRLRWQILMILFSVESWVAIWRDFLV